MQRDLQAALAEASEGTAALLRLSQEGLDDLTARAAARWGSAITDATGQAVTLGAEITVGPIDRAFGGQIRGITQSATTDLLGIVSGFSTDLVQGATLDLRRRIRGELSSVLAGARTPGDAARLIGRNLTSANHFSTVYARARAITVTELGRVSALAGQKSQEDLTRALGQAGGFATVAKRWINAHLPGARPDHLQAEADYAETGRYGPIPIDATYMIGGFPALYPHDPALPAGQSVNCHCVSVTVLPCGPFKLREAVNAQGDACMIDPLSRPAPKTSETMIRAATLEVGDETTEGAIVKSVTVGPDGKLKVRFEQGFSMGFNPDERVRIRVPSVEPAYQAPTEGAS